MSASAAAQPELDANWLFELGSDRPGSMVDGLVRVDDFDPMNEVPEVVAVLEKARRYGAHSVFFEAARNGRPPVAQAFIFVAEGGLDDATFAEIHKRLWSWGGVPLLYRVVPGQIQLFRCAHKPDFAVGSGAPICNPVRTLELGATIAAADGWWDRERLRNGTLWDDPAACQLMLSPHGSSHRKLVETVRRLASRPLGREPPGPEPAPASTDPLPLDRLP